MLHVDDHSRFRLTAMHRMRYAYADWRTRYAPHVPTRDQSDCASFTSGAQAALGKAFGPSAEHIIIFRAIEHSFCELTIYEGIKNLFLLQIFSEMGPWRIHLHRE